MASDRAGELTGINQKRLGKLVNFEFGAGASEFGGSFSACAGVILQKRIGLRVETGENLCLVYLNESFLQEADQAQICEDFLNCFSVR